MDSNSKERYKEEFHEGSDLLWPSDKEDKITRKFYRDLSHFTRNTNQKRNKKLNLIQQIILIITGKGSSPNK